MGRSDGYLSSVQDAALTGYAGATADITARALTISATGVNKEYDGNKTATVNLSDNRISGDTLTSSYAAAEFSDKNVGSAKTVSVSGIAIAGADKDNYTLASTLASGSTYYFTVTASSDAGLESDFSGEIRYTTPFPRPELRLASVKRGLLLSGIGPADELKAVGAPVARSRIHSSRMKPRSL